MATQSISFLRPKPPSPVLLHHHHLSSKPSLSLLLPIPKPSFTIRCSTLGTPKLVRYPALDRQAARASRLRFARKLTTLLLSKPRHFLPLRVLRRCRRFLGLPPSRPLLPFLLRYPTLFRLFHSPSLSPSSLSASLLSVSLTPAASSLAADLSLLRSTRLAAPLAAKLHRLLLLSPHRRLLLSKLVHLAPDLGFSMDFRSSICARHHELFTIVDTSYGRALQLTSCDSPLPAPLPPFRPVSRPDRIIDRPPKFPHLQLRRGLNLRRGHRDYLLRLNGLPEVSPFEALDAGADVEMAEKRACAAVREVLGMTVEKRTLVDHLTHFRKDFGLPNRLRAMLVRHPEMFYVSVKGVRHSVFLVEAFDDEGRLVVEDELLVGRDRLEELVREGKRLRRARRRGLAVDSDDKEGDSDEDEEEEEGPEVDDEFGDLFEAGIGEDWEEIGDGGNEDDDAELDAIEEFWVKKAVAEGLVAGSEELEVW